MGLEGLTGCSSDFYRSLCHLCLMSLSPHLPQLSPSLLSLQRGTLLDSSIRLFTNLDIWGAHHTHIHWAPAPGQPLCQA